MNIVEKINEVLDTIRPYLNSDGGDVEFVRYEDGIVYVRLLGACSHCGMANITLESMVFDALTFEIPEIIKIVNLDE